MAFKAKDGKSFGNRQQMSAYNDRGGSKAMPDQQEEPAEGEDQNTDQNSPEDIHEMVEHHGPAEKVEISHAEGKHTKTSHHGGKKHVSEHGSAEEAHHHGMMAAGVEPAGGEAEPAMSGGGAMQEGGIPGM